MNDLPDLRAKLEAMDRELLSIIQRRLELAAPIAEKKLSSASPFRDLPREAVVFSRVRAIALDLGIDPHRAEALYRLLLEWSVARQQDHLHGRADVPLRVAYQGVEGCYTHLAAQKRYAGRPAGAWLTGHPTFRAATQAVRSGEAHVALLPIENTTAGSVSQTYDLLAAGGITITAEVISHIQHCLLALPGATLEGLRTVHSHPQALHQCEAFFEEHPWLTPVDAFDTAGAARMVRDRGEAQVAAIASEAAGTRYGLQILARDLQTQVGNYTRFVEVATESATVAGEIACKTSLVLELTHEPGALGRVLAAFTRHGIDLTKLESRPILGQAWRYRFYLDVDGHGASEPVEAAIEAARAECVDLRILGSYPRAEI